jgi:S1-C subfamily serine protease
LVVDWPAADRGDATLSLDGKPMAVPKEGPIALKVKPGKHVVGILRKDFEPVRGEVQVAKGTTETFQPQWKEVVAVASNTQPAPAVGGESPSSFPVGTAIVIPGFEGWQQVLAVAKDKAANEKKDILIVFGSSDGNPATVELARALKDAGLPGGSLGERFVPLVIDHPETDTGLNRVLDYRQNRRLSGEYAIGDELPVLALADDQGRPYAIQREWPAGVAAADKVIQSLAAQKQDRDTRLAAANQGTPQEQLAAAVDFLKWLSEKKLMVQYRDAIHPWWSLAEKEDPTNAAGKQEVVLEAEMLCKLSEIPDDPGAVDIVQRLDVLQPWLQDRRFADADRGFKLHFLAGNILGRIGEEDSAIAHITRAATYDPKAPELQIARKALAGLSRGVISNGTGFLVADGGYILTNKHVVEGPGRVAVQVTEENEPILAKSVKLHPTLDIALVQVDLPESHRPDAIGMSTTKPSLGLEVGALGYPLSTLLGEGLKFTEGVVSSLPNSSRKDMILLDMRINFGNSGGPLCDKQGNVIGMITAKIGDAGDASFGMAIPAEALDAFLVEVLPPDAKRGSLRPTIPNSDWPAVTKAVSPAVLMIVKLR